MRVFDLHCDTLCECLDRGISLSGNDAALDLTRGDFDGWVQVFACFIHDDYSGDAAFSRFLALQQTYEKELSRDSRLCRYRPGMTLTPGTCAGLLAVEGGRVLGGDLSKIKTLQELGVSILTLVWNGDNELGSGVLGQERGLTDLGRAAIPLLEEAGIIVDISHLNRQGTAEVLALAKKPVIASHSNLFSVHPHPRNLDDEYIRQLAAMGGLCGINFYPLFVDGGIDSPPEAFHRHLDGILSLGGEDILALGSDFDGATMPHWLPGTQGLAVLYGYVVQWYGQKLADKLFYENAAAFWERYQ